MKSLRNLFKNKRFFWTFDVVFLVLMVMIDQLIKWSVRSKVKLGEQVVAIPGILNITDLKNTGAAWSFLTGHSWVFVLIAIVAIVVISYLIYLFRNNHWLAFGLSLVLAGSIGNLIDRLFVGYVTDMLQISFLNFPVFNVADMCVTIGVLILLLAILFGDSDERK